MIQGVVPERTLMSKAERPSGQCRIVVCPVSALGGGGAWLYGGFEDVCKFTLTNLIAAVSDGAVNL